MGLDEYLNSLSNRYHNIAYVFAALGYVFQALLHIAFKYVCKTISPFQGLFMRAFCLFTLSCYILRRSQESVYIRNQSVFRQMLKRLFFSSTYGALIHYCVKYLPISTVVSLSNTGPVFIFFIQAAYYKKPLNKVNLSFAILSFIGILLVIQPEFLFSEPNSTQIQNYTFLTSLVIVAALCFATTMLYVHDLSKKVNTLTSLHYSYMGHMMLTAILSNFQHPVIEFNQIDIKFILAFFLVVLLALMAQYMIFASTSLKEPSLTMPLGYVAIMIGFIADVAFFGIQFNATSTVGLFLTSAGLLSKLFIKSDKPKQKSIKGTKEQQQEQAAKRKSDCDQHIQKI